MINLAEYANLKICVAVSGGRDSMALLHYIESRAGEYGITLSALNCDHRIRGEKSARDSAFVREWCGKHKIPLMFFEWDSPLPKTEANARFWRLKCYSLAVLPCTLPDGTGWGGADAVATAHHLNDNAETVLFNLARGSALSGLDGITDFTFPASDGRQFRVIHPMISCTREEIDGYIRENEIPYVEDETNFTDDYTRNKIRHCVLPELERAVRGASKAIFRFSRLASEDEQYFNDLIAKRGLIKNSLFGKQISFCEEKVVFRRAAVKVIKDCFNKKDYTSEHANALYNLQFAENGKRFEFLGLIAYKEEGRIVIDDGHLRAEAETGRPFNRHLGMNATAFAGQVFVIAEENELKDVLALLQSGQQKTDAPVKYKTLKFDAGTIPPTAVIRFMKEGDKFTKFGGGTKSLGDWFTDRKIPVRLRKRIPLVADGNDVLAVGGAEISDKIKITANTDKTMYIICTDYLSLIKGD